MIGEERTDNRASPRGAISVGTLGIAETKSRRTFLGGSDARIIMGSDDSALHRLWREKRGEAEPQDLSKSLLVQLGKATEPLNRQWYELNSGKRIRDVQRHVRHPVLNWMGATLDGLVTETGAVFESKFMLPWSFSEESAAEKHIAQLQHNMWVVQSRSAVLSIITGGGKWVEITIAADALYQHLLLAAEKRFRRCVLTGERPFLVWIGATAATRRSRPHGRHVRLQRLGRSRGRLLPHARGLQRARKRQSRTQGADAKGCQGSGGPRRTRQAIEIGSDQLRRP